MKAIAYRLALVGVLCSLIGLGAAAPVRAQKPIEKLTSLTVSVWLDYDKQGALYIYTGELASDVALPAHLTFRIPAAAAAPSSTAGIDNSGNYRYTRPTVTTEGDSLVVSYDTQWPRFQLEYYVDTIKRQSSDFSFELVYQPDYAIEQLVLEIKEPYAATNLVVDPPADTRAQAEDGLMVHRRVVGPVAPGKAVTWKASYSRTDTRLASEALRLPTPAPASYETAGGAQGARPAGNLPVVAMVAVLVAAALAIAGLVLYRGAQRRTAPVAPPPGPAPAARKRQARKKQPGAAGPPEVQRSAYCHQCGARQAKDDVFCRRCGTRRRGA